jgi:SAM-dependent methyltransferase
MPGVDFDDYVDDYRDIINRVSSISGEQFEFFIQLRLGLMKSRLGEPAADAAAVRILDFGCGTGSTETYLKEFFPNAVIFGVDASAESIRAAQGIKLDGVAFVHSDALELPFPDDSFDLIYSNGTYHHIEPNDHERILFEMSRVCRPGGSLFIFENNPKNPLMMRAMQNNPFDKDATVVPPARLRKQTQTAGFLNREICYYFFFPKFLRRLRPLEKWLGWLPFGAQYFLWARKPERPTKPVG